MKKDKRRAKTRIKRELAKAMEDRALAKRKKPFTTVKNAARGTPEDADDLLAAIRLLRQDDV